ncbi:MAG: hypothetical protein K6B70_00180 [Clostridia bacterium]|nr:hypothetical protein [Clostridia bacterium]
MKNNLLVAGIFNIIVGCFWLLASVQESSVVFVIGAFVLVAGVMNIIYSKLEPEKLYEKRNIVLIWGILLIPFNLISAVLLLVDSDRIKSEYAKYLKEQDVQVLDSNNNNIKVSKEKKKLDILLKIGIGMVAVSGIMIATTSWEVITDFVKLILIAVIGVLFLGLSIFSDKKLKIRGTTITYWLLSMIAFSLSIFMLGYYEMLGDWFSIKGSGSDFFIATLMTCISAFAYITYKRFDMESFLFFSYFGMVSAIILVAAGITKIDWNIDEVYIMLISRSIILALTSLLCAIFIKNKKANYITLSIVIPLVLLSLIFEVNVVIALYVGIIALAMIIFGFIKKEYKAVFAEGIVFLILNLVIQLWEFWGLLPVWAYLLVGGLTLIGIVTVKELSKSKEE